MAPSTIVTALALLAAAAVIAAALRQHPAVECVRSRLAPRDRVQAAVEQALTPPEPEPRAIGTPGPRPFLLWCFTCREFLTFCCAGHAIGHARDHAHDLALWERELSDRTAS